MSSLLLTELFFFFNSREEIPTFAKFGDNVELNVIFEHFEDLDYVRVRYASQHIRLLDEILQVPVVLANNLFDHFDSPLLAIVFASANEDISEGT